MSEQNPSIVINVQNPQLDIAFQKLTEMNIYITAQIVDETVIITETSNKTDAIELHLNKNRRFTHEIATVPEFAVSYIDYIKKSLQEILERRFQRRISA